MIQSKNRCNLLMRGSIEICIFKICRRKLQLRFRLGTFRFKRRNLSSTIGHVTSIKVKTASIFNPALPAFKHPWTRLTLWGHALPVKPEKQRRNDKAESRRRIGGSADRPQEQADQFFWLLLSFLFSRGAKFSFLFQPKCWSAPDFKKLQSNDMGSFTKLQDSETFSSLIFELLNNNHWCERFLSRAATSSSPVWVNESETFWKVDIRLIRF